MPFLVNILLGLAWVLNAVLTVYTIIILAACLFSWIKPNPFHPAVRFVRALTEPVFWRIRKHLPFTYAGGFDLSPLVLLLVVQFLQYAVVKSIREIAISMA